MGSGAARNTGLEAAGGEYVIYCDGDDWVDPDMYEKLYIKAREDNADIVMCDYYEENEVNASVTIRILSGIRVTLWNRCWWGSSIPVYGGLWFGKACMRIIIFSFLLG